MNSGIFDLAGKYRLEAANFVAGMAVLIFELTASRVVAPYIGATIYTWTGIIGVILGALALGYGLGGYLADKRKRVEDVVLLLIGAGLFIFALILLKDLYLEWLGGTALPFKLQGLLASLVLFFIPTLLLGMASPYLARLSITDVGSSGRRIARINAAGALGSLVGVFMAGYLLFDHLGTDKILAFLSLGLVLSTFLLSLGYIFAGRVLIILLMLAGAVYTTTDKEPSLVADVDSAYQRIIVKDLGPDGQRIRVMQTDKLGLQSGIYLDGDRQNLVFPYLRAFDYLASPKDGTKNFLVIGGGTFTFPSKLAYSKPGSQTDVVEIDPKLEDISKKYFGFEPKLNLNIVNTDGRQYLNSNEKLYDIIFIDAFNSVSPPFQLTTEEAVQYTRASLREDGIVAVNVISAASGDRAKTIRSLVKTYSQVFEHVAVFQVNSSADPYDFAQNLILVASDRPFGESLAGVAQINEESSAIFSRPLTIEADKGVLLTDNYAPIENMIPQAL